MSLNFAMPEKPIPTAKTRGISIRAVIADIRFDMIRYMNRTTIMNPRIARFDIPKHPSFMHRVYDSAKKDVKFKLLIVRHQKN